MNEQLQKFAREQIKEGMAQLNASHHRIFRLMYGRNNGKRGVADAEAMPIDDVLAEMDGTKLDWAMQQVQRSIQDLKSQPASV